MSKELVPYSNHCARFKKKNFVFLRIWFVLVGRLKKVTDIIKLIAAVKVLRLMN